ncbi:MAG: N-acyl homoserine lactonase family protein [Desulfurellaceae bacterium]|nr:N-acyl homoserine lactonase family protein [Desulfurellaceae bacterium]
MLQIFSMPCGFLEFDSKLFFPNLDKGEQFTIPVPSYLITHPQGNVVFDTGIHCQAIHDPLGRLGSIAKVFVPRTQPGQEIVAQLAKFKLTPQDIRYVINSHFHFDHAGGNEFFPDSTILVQKEELGATRDPALLKKVLFDPKDYDHELDYREIEGELDIFGDGSLVLFPTHGHTPGHQSLRVRVSKGSDIVLTADACYTQKNMDENLLPSIAFDETEMYKSLATLRDLRDKSGATIIYGHDPRQWQEIPHAPQPLA